VKYFICAVAFLMGSLWGAVHGTIWLQMHIPVLFKLAQLARNKPYAQIPAATGRKVLSGFIGSLFGTGAVGGVFAFLQDSTVALSFYAFGLFVGFAPSLAITLWRYILIAGAGFAGVWILKLNVLDLFKGPLKGLLG
jgi:hypothetical protein